MNMKRCPIHTPGRRIFCSAAMKCFLVMLTLAMNSLPLPAEEIDPSSTVKSVAVFTMPHNDPAILALSREAAEYVERTFDRMGRFLPAEHHRVQWALTQARTGQAAESAVSDAARLLNTDLYVVISVSRSPRFSYAVMEIRGQKHQALRKTWRIRSRIARNIPLKLGREIALFHRGIGLSADIIRRYDNGQFLLNAGQWHGLRAGKTYQTGNTTVTILQTGRFISLAETASRTADINHINFGNSPDAEGGAAVIDVALERTTIANYGLGTTLLKHENAEHRYIEGLCIINPGGNLCLPGYGAFLATEYLRFQNARPDVPGIAVSVSAFLVHLALPSAATGFKCNFFPWERDSDKSEAMQRLHIFLWGTIPFNFSVAYMDQLAHLFHTTEHLPPFFENRNTMAGFMSFIIPGGGMFYKGHRFAGWCYYFSELSLGGYSVYNWENGNRGKIALGALGLIKLIDILNSVLIGPSYSFFTAETERDASSVSLETGMYRTGENEEVYSISLTRPL
ncbi:MAG TPA: hypothetical protein PLI62_00070 [Spirochaetota bacterium]|nr:hypothetical protein [Spirochaetota bacterium]